MGRRSGLRNQVDDIGRDVVDDEPKVLRQGEDVGVDAGMAEVIAALATPLGLSVARRQLLIVVRG
jgi:hypothetical protein